MATSGDTIQKSRVNLSQTQKLTRREQAACIDVPVPAIIISVRHRSCVQHQWKGKQMVGAKKRGPRFGKGGIQGVRGYSKVNLQVLGQGTWDTKTCFRVLVH